MRYGIVLAAGEATRLPNKVLLPIANKSIAIESSMAFMIQSGCKEIIVVENDTQLVSRVLRMRRWSFKSVLQKIPEGVPQAIKLSAYSCPEGSTMIVSCADNIYESFAKADDSYPFPNCAMTRLYNSSDLDYWNPDTNRWHTRDVKDEDRHMLLGHLVLQRNDVMKSSVYNETLVDLLNDVKAMPISMTSYCRDIGSAKEYAEYLDSIV